MRYDWGKRVKKFLLTFIQYAILIGISIGMYHYCLDLFSRFNTFPIDYHPDEWTKAAQIIDNERNFNHPQLMLEATDYIIERDQIPKNQWDVLIAGRTTSARMAALGAVAAAWAGWFAGRWIGFLAIAIGAGLCPSLLAHAHYFKEEAALCLGIGCVVGVAGAMSVRWHWAIMLLLAYYMGEACGVAASGKYSGLIMIAPGLLMVLMATTRRWVIMPFCLVLFVFGFYHRWTEINWRVLEDWNNFWIKFIDEKDHAFTEHSGVALGKPNGYFLDAAWSDAMPHIKLLVILAPLALVYLTFSRWLHWLKDDKSAKPRYRPSVLFGWWLILSMTIYAVGLSYSAIPFFRYALPLIFLLNILAGIAIVWIYHSLARPAWLRAAFVVIALSTLLTTQWLRCQDFLYQHRFDSRDELPKWIAENLKGTVRIVCDGYTALSAGDVNNFNPNLQIGVTRIRFAGSAGSVEYLRQQGFNYVITAGPSYERWISPYSIKPESDSENFDEMRNFYLELMSKYPVVKEFKAHYPMNTFTNPDIVIYRIDQGPKK